MKYDPKQIEPKWQTYWDKTGLYNTPEKPTKKFYLLEMFAYPSGDIHMGHFRNYTIGDVFWRYKKMQGYDLLHPFGWDAFGLPAEEAALSHQRHPRDWTLNNINTSRHTLKKMAISYDWAREVITCNPDYYKWTQWIFCLLYKRGLAYRGTSLVNWCPGCKTVLANEQIANGRCWRCQSEVTKQELEQWFFKITAYAERLLDDLDKLIGWPENIKTMQRNWIGRSEGTEIQFPLLDSELRTPNSQLSVFTTRPDTIYGVTFMVIAPEHPLALKLTTPAKRAEVEAYIKQAIHKSDIERTAVGEKDGVFTGQYAINPLSEEKVQLWVADYVLVHYGTGIVMGVPAHDQRDFEFAHKYNIPIKVVINPVRSKTPKASAPDLRRGTSNGVNPPGSSIPACQMEQQGMAGRQNPESMTQAYVEPGIMVNSGPFDGVPSEEGIKKVTDYVKEKGYGNARVYYRLKDWLISRQRYWGAPIPMIHCPKCGIVPVPEKDLPILLPADIKDYIPKGRSPLADLPEFMNVKCPKCKGKAQRDPDTMDTFVCSSWYHLRYSDPTNNKKIFDKPKVANWLPIDLYIGGAEHACGHLLYFRFITKVLHDAGWLKFDEPAIRLFNHGMVLDAQGEIMSKSKGNVISPAQLMGQWGVDTARLAMLFFAPSDWEIRWTEKGLVGASRFLNRAWNLVNEVNNRIKQDSTENRLNQLNPVVKSLYRKTHQTIKKVTEDIDPALQFNTAISAIMELVNKIYEVKNNNRIKQDLTENQSRLKQRDPVVKEAARTVVILLAPFVPHLSEELWKVLGEKPSIFGQPWPSYDTAALVAEEIELVIQVNGRVRSRIMIATDTSEETIKEKALADDKIKKLLAGKSPKKVIVVPGRLVNIVV